MKRMKKVFAFLLTMVMVLAMAVPAMAAENTLGNITIKGAIKDATYTAYKVFDATYSDGAVSYTIPSGSTIASVEGFSGVFTTTSNGDKTYVTINSDASPDDVITWLKSHESNIATQSNKKAETTNTAGNASVVLATDAAGYYYITATIGESGKTGFRSAVTIDTAQPTATVNSKISDTPKVPEDGKKIDDKTVNTMDVGQSAAFTLTFYATNYAVSEDGTATKITSYTVTDTMDGFSLYTGQMDALTVTVGGTIVSSTKSDTAPYFTTSYTNDVLTIVIYNYDKGNYTSPSAVVVSYNATLTNKNVVGESTNAFKVKYNDTEIPNTPGTKTYNYKVVIDKYQTGSEITKLAGAKFVLKDGKGTNAKFYKVDATTGVVSWVGDQTDATVVTTDANGSANFQGLKAGTYYLVETEAPAGYNLLTAPITVTLSEITAALTKGDDGTFTTLSQTAKVANNTGAELPSTGGIGTTLFYVIGAICVLGAGVLLVTRRRMASK